MHVALAAWAMDELVTDRDAAPWPALRDQATRGSAYGVDAALRSYTSCTAASQFDAGALVQALIRQAPLSPGPNDATIVLWLLGVGIDRCSRGLAHDEPGLRALIERRASISERLALELDEGAFTAPDLGGFDPEGSSDDAPTIYLSPMEALLLDIAVAPAEPEDAWLTHPQAEQLFGQRAREANERARDERRRTAAAFAVASVLAGGCVALSLALKSADTLAAVCWGLALAMAGASLANRYIRSDATNRARVDAVGVACIVGALCAALNATNQILHRPLLPDAAGLIAGTAITTLSGLLWILLTKADGPRSPRP
jgi:hypothetical protein